MESLSLSHLAVKLVRQFEESAQPSIYFIARWSDHTFCSRSKPNISKDWVSLVSNDQPIQMDFPKAHSLFRLEIWDYDRQEKIGETNVTNGDLPINERQKQFSINDRKIQLKFQYERRGRLEEMIEAENATIRISYNKTDNGPKYISKPSSPYIRKVISPSQQSAATTNTTVKYDPSYYGKWKFIPARNDFPTQKLKL